MRKKKLGVKKIKKAAKSEREKPKVPVKKSGKWPEMAFTPTFGFQAQKKKTLLGVSREGRSERTSCSDSTRNLELRSQLGVRDSL